MATAQMDTVIRHLRRAVLRQDGAGWTDGQLLASFIDQKDEAAFEALVRRHGPMVFGVCRRVVGNHHDAEDAFQATFLVLARKASTVRPRERVANWLHGVALRTAMKAKATTGKRQWREKQVTDMPEPEAAPHDLWDDLQPLLDQELNRLPENYRLPILLCDLEGKTIKEATRQLGWPQGTVAGRLARGRKLLAKRLANRGVVLSAGSLAAVVSQNVASAVVPTLLMSSTIKAATMVAGGQATVAGVVPAKVAALMEGVMKAMLMTKLKTVTAVLLVVTAVGMGGGLLSRSTTAAAQTADERPKAAGKQNADQRTPKVTRDDRTTELRTGSLIFGVGPNVNGFFIGGDFMLLNSLEYQIPVKANDQIYLVPFVDSGTVDSPTALPEESKADARRTDLDRLQGVWSVVSIEQGGKPAKLEKAVFMVDGKRACWQTGESEMQGGLYLDAISKPKTYDFVMSTRTMEGIYSLDGDTLRLCHDLGTEPKRPVGFATEKGSQQVLFVLKRTHGPEVFPYRLPDGTRAFPPVIERAKTTPPPQVAPTPKDNSKYNPGFTTPGSDEPPASKNRQQDFPVKASEGKRVPVQATEPDFPVKANGGKRVTVESEEQKKLQGTWRLVVGGYGKHPKVPGVAAGQNILKTTDITIDGNEWIGWMRDGKQHKVAFRVDASRTLDIKDDGFASGLEALGFRPDAVGAPKGIDIEEVGGDYVHGIYGLGGDDLVIRLLPSGKQGRPTQFAMTSEDGVLLLYKRIKPQHDTAKDSAEQPPKR